MPPFHTQLCERSATHASSLAFPLCHANPLGHIFTLSGCHCIPIMHLSLLFPPCHARTPPTSCAYLDSCLLPLHTIMLLTNLAFDTRCTIPCIYPSHPPSAPRPLPCAHSGCSLPVLHTHQVEVTPLVLRQRSTRPCIYPCFPPVPCAPAPGHTLPMGTSMAHPSS